MITNLNFFTILDDILTKKHNGKLDEHPEFKKVMSNFMIVRYISMRDNLIPYARILNKYQFKLNSVDLYKWAFYNIPKQRNGFIHYISKK